MFSIVAGKEGLQQNWSCKCCVLSPGWLLGLSSIKPLWLKQTLNTPPFCPLNAVRSLYFSRKPTHTVWVRSTGCSFSPTLCVTTSCVTFNLIYLTKSVLHQISHTQCSQALSSLYIYKHWDLRLKIVFKSLLSLTDSSWVESGARVLKLGVLPVKALLVVGEHVWASSGGQIFIISTQTHTVEVVQHFSHIYIMTTLKILAWEWIWQFKCIFFWLNISATLLLNRCCGWLLL